MITKSLLVLQPSLLTISLRPRPENRKISTSFLSGPGKQSDRCCSSLDHAAHQPRASNSHGSEAPLRRTRMQRRGITSHSASWPARGGRLSSGAVRAMTRPRTARRSECSALRRALKYSFQGTCFFAFVGLFWHLHHVSYLVIRHVGFVLHLTILSHWRHCYCPHSRMKSQRLHCDKHAEVEAHSRNIQRRATFVIPMKVVKAFVNHIEPPIITKKGLQIFLGLSSSYKPSWENV